MSIPWSQLHYASSQVEAEGLQVVVKLGFNEHNQKVDTPEDQHAKMVSLAIYWLIILYFIILILLFVGT